MSTEQSFENLAESVEILVADHKQRIHRLRTRRDRIASKDSVLAEKLGRVRAAVDELSRTMSEVLEECVMLDDAEIAETSGVAMPEAKPVELVVLNYHGKDVQPYERPDLPQKAQK